MTDLEIRKIARLAGQELAKHLQPQDPFDEFLGIEDAARMLGCSVSTLRSNSKSVPHHKPFKELVFSRRELENFIRTH